MINLILRYRLQDHVTPAAFEEWVRTTDQPALRGLTRVKRFDTYRTTGLLVGDGQPSSAYFEVFEIDDIAGFQAEDMPGKTVQAIMISFMGLVTDFEFNLVEQV